MRRLTTLAGLLAVLLATSGCGVYWGWDEPQQQHHGHALPQTAPLTGIGVVGLSATGRLPVHRLPGTHQKVITYLHPGQVGLSLTGKAYVLDDLRWVKIRLEKERGWVTAVNVAPIAHPVDATKAYRNVPAATTPLDLAKAVAAARASKATGDLAHPVIVKNHGLEVVIETRGYPGPRLAGERVDVVARKGPSGGYLVKSVRVQPICARAVTVQGTCQ